MALGTPRATSVSLYYLVSGESRVVTIDYYGWGTLMFKAVTQSTQYFAELCL